jgi:hypothetical protein
MKSWKKFFQQPSKDSECAPFRDYHIWAKPSREIKLSRFDTYAWIRRYARFPVKTGDMGWIWRINYFRLVINPALNARLVTKVVHRSSIKITKPLIYRPFQGLTISSDSHL